MSFLKRNSIVVCLILVAQFLRAQFVSVPGGWVRDIEMVKTELPKLHADFFRRLHKKDWEKQLEELKLSIANKTDVERTLMLQAIIAQAGDPLTTIEMTSIFEKERYIPVGFGFFNGSYYVSASVKRFAPIFGCKVLKINNFPMRDAVEKVAQFVPKENDEGYLNTVLQMMRFPVVNRLAEISTTDTLDLLCEKRETGERFRFKVWTLSPQEDKPGMIPVIPMRDAPDLLFFPRNQLYKMEWHERDSILIFQYNMCLSREMMLERGDTSTAMQLPNFQPFKDSVFNFMRRHPSARLIFDLRYNPGGTANDGYQMAMEMAADPVLNQKNRVFVAINSSTRAEATLVAYFFKKLTKATLVGEPTGDRLNHFEQKRPLYLPNNQLIVSYSARFNNIAPDIDPPNLSPDVFVPLDFDTFLAGKDPVLAWLREKRGKK